MILHVFSSFFSITHASVLFFFRVIAVDLCKTIHKDCINGSNLLSILAIQYKSIAHVRAGGCGVAFYEWKNFWLNSSVSKAEI